MTGPIITSKEDKEDQDIVKGKEDGVEGGERVEERERREEEKRKEE